MDAPHRRRASAILLGQGTTRELSGSAWDFLRIHTAACRRRAPRASRHAALLPCRQDTTDLRLLAELSKMWSVSCLRGDLHRDVDEPAESCTLVQGAQWCGSPPVEVAQEPHYRGHDQHPHDGGIEGDRDR